MPHRQVTITAATILLGASLAACADSKEHLQIIRHRRTGKLVAVERASNPAGELRIYELGRGRPIPLKNPAKAASRPAGSGRTGFYKTRFTRRSPHSNLDHMLGRLGWRKQKKRKDYDLKSFSFEVYVPPGYDGSKPYGLMVYISPAPYVYFMQMSRCRSVYNKHSLIHVAAYNSGNKQDVWVRLGLAMDAVHNIKRAYNIDSNRVYATGVSGGGRCASMLGLGFADVFDGAMLIVGCYFFKIIMSLENPKKGWSAKFTRPPGVVYRKAKLTNRYALITGQHDYNRTETESTYVNGYKKLNFKHATYIEVPGMGHSCPPARIVERGVTALDKPLKSGGGSMVPPAVAASAAMRAAQRMLKAEKHEDAYAELADLAEKYPTTASAAKAKRMIAELDRTHPKIAACGRYDRARHSAVDSLARGWRQIAEKKTSQARKTLVELITTHPDHPEAKKAIKLLETIWSDKAPD